MNLLPIGSIVRPARGGGVARAKVIGYHRQANKELWYKLKNLRSGKVIPWPVDPENVVRATDKPFLTAQDLVLLRDMGISLGGPHVNPDASGVPDASGGI